MVCPLKTNQLLVVAGGCLTDLKRGYVKKWVIFEAMMLKVAVCGFRTYSRHVASMPKISLTDWEEKLVDTVVNYQLNPCTPWEELSTKSFFDVYKSHFPLISKGDAYGLKLCPFRAEMSAVLLKMAGFNEMIVPLRKLPFTTLESAASQQILADIFNLPWPELNTVKSSSCQWVSGSQARVIKRTFVEFLHSVSLDDKAHQIDRIDFGSRKYSLMTLTKSMLDGFQFHNQDLLCSHPSPMYVVRTHLLREQIREELNGDSSVPSVFSPLLFYVTERVCEKLLGSKEYAKLHYQCEYPSLPSRLSVLKSLGPFSEEEILEYFKDPSSSKGDLAVKRMLCYLKTVRRRAKKRCEVIKPNCTTVENIMRIDNKRLRLKANQESSASRGGMRDYSKHSNFSEKLDLINQNLDLEHLSREVKRELACYLIFKEFGHESLLYCKDSKSSNEFDESSALCDSAENEDDYANDCLTEDEFDENEMYDWENTDNRMAWYRRPLVSPLKSRSLSVRQLSSCSTSSNREFSTSSQANLGFKYNGAKKSFWLDLAEPNIFRWAKVNMDLLELRQRVDRSFDKKEFLEGCKMAVPVITGIIRDGNYDDLAGLLTKRARAELVDKVENLWPPMVKELIGVDKEDIAYAYIIKVNVYSVVYDTYADLTVVFDCGKTSPDSLKKEVFSLQMTFSKKYSKDSLKDWVITDVDLLAMQYT